MVAALLFQLCQWLPWWWTEPGRSVCASASFHRWHSIYTHHFLTTISCPVCQQHRHGGRALLLTTLRLALDLCLVFHLPHVWEGEIFDPAVSTTHSKRRDFLSAWSQCGLTSQRGWGISSIGYNPNAEQFPFLAISTVSRHCRKASLLGFFF